MISQRQLDANRRNAAKSHDASLPRGADGLAVCPEPDVCIPKAARFFLSNQL
jgi:hypothetical protein